MNAGRVSDVSANYGVVPDVDVITDTVIVHDADVISDFALVPNIEVSDAIITSNVDIVAVCTSDVRDDGTKNRETVRKSMYRKSKTISSALETIQRLQVHQQAKVFRNPWSTVVVKLWKLSSCLISKV